MDETPNPPSPKPEDYGAQLPESLATFDVPAGASNGAMEEPRDPADYGRAENVIPPGHMLTPAGIVPCFIDEEESFGDRVGNVLDGRGGV